MEEFAQVIAMFVSSSMFVKYFINKVEGSIRLVSEDIKDFKNEQVKQGNRLTAIETELKIKLER